MDLVFVSTLRMCCKLKRDEIRMGGEEERGKEDDDGSEEVRKRNNILICFRDVSFQVSYKCSQRVK